MPSTRKTTTDDLAARIEQAAKDVPPGYELPPGAAETFLKLVLKGNGSAPESRR